MTIDQALKQAIEAHQSQKLQDAERLYRAILKVHPNHPDANHNLGLLALGVGKLEEGLPHLSAALAANPKYEQFWISYIRALIETGRLAEAGKAIEDGRRSGLSDKAAQQLEERLGASPVQAPSQNKADELLASYKAGSFELTERLARELTRNYPRHTLGWKTLGAALFRQGKVEGALAAMQYAVQLNPDDAEAHLHLGYPLINLGRVAEAEASLRKAIALQPDLAEAHCNLGTLLKELGRLPEAESSLRNAIRCRPDYAEANWKLSTNLLLQSRLRSGFELYEWRWAGTDEQKKYTNDFVQPLWLGKESLVGKTILIHAEQGLGDTILFSRYLKLVHELGARVIFQVQRPLMFLLAGLEGVDELVGKGQPLPGFDCHCPLMSLALAFKTDLDSIPSRVPYLFAQPERIQRWAEKLGEHGFKIGICWKGAGKDRFVPVEHFHALSRIPGVRLISLQKGETQEELASLPDGMAIETNGDEFDSDGAFMDTVAIMKCCDLVVSSDTSIAHVAGALGVPTWIALLFVPDWRWMMDRADSPWYPSVRLFRQPASGDWKGVFEQMGSVLRSHLLGRV